jgi:hypothetical protein
VNVVLTPSFIPEGILVFRDVEQGKQWLPCLPSPLAATREQKPTYGIDKLMLSENQII